MAWRICGGYLRHSAEASACGVRTGAPPSGERCPGAAWPSNRPGWACGAWGLDGPCRPLRRALLLRQQAGADEGCAKAGPWRPTH